MLYFYRLGSHSWCTVSMSLVKCLSDQMCLCCWLHTVWILFRIHSWGDSLEEAFEQCAMGMFGYMTDTETVEPLDTVDVESEGQSTQFEWSCIVYIYQLCCCQMTWTKVYACVFIFSKGEDMESLLFHFLDDWLYKFSADLFFVPRVSWSISDEYFFNI